MQLNKGTLSGPTAVFTPLFKNASQEARIRSLIGALVLPPHSYKNATSFSYDQIDHPDSFHFTGDMRCESNRLKTFEKWPVTFLSPEQVARNGFYYLGQGDVVRCAFCNVKILKWVEGDDPAKEHQRWTPECPFVLKLMSAKNPTSRDECGFGMAAFTASRRVGPAHPCYSTKAARLRSFQSWPQAMRQKAEDLAEAGLYYTGQGDKTICFYCDGGLKNWEENDVPWEQHARWFNKCAYVELMKGRDYIQKVLSAYSKPVPNTEKIIPEKSATVTTAPTENGDKLLDKSKLCIICCEKERNVCFVPCGHVVACANCALTVEKCPMCRSPFQSAVRLYFS